MNKENCNKRLSSKLWRLPATIAISTGLFTSCDQEGHSPVPITDQPDKTTLIESPSATPISEPTLPPTEAPTQTVSPTETPVASYLEQEGFVIVTSTEEALRFKKDNITFNFDALVAAGGPEIPPEIDPVVLFENITKRFEINQPVNIKLEFDSAAQRYFYTLENGSMIDQGAEEPIEYKEGSYLFPFPNDIVPAEIFASADLVAWSRSGANTMEQLKLELIEQDTEQESQGPSYQLVVVSQAGPPDWAWQEPEEAITYPVDEEEIERLGLEVPAVEEEAEAVRILESQPTSPEELFDLTQYTEVFNQEASNTQIRILYEDDQTYVENGVEKPYFIRHVRPEYINQEGEPDNQELAQMLLDWSLRIQKDTNQLDGRGYWGAALDEPFLTVIDAGALLEKIEERLQQGIDDQEIIPNLDCYQQVNLSFDEIDEVIVISQGAYPADNQPISFEDYTLPLQLDEKTTVYTNRGVNLANSKLYNLITNFLFEDESGKTTLVAFRNSTGQYLYSTPKWDTELSETFHIGSHLSAVLDTAYGTSFNKNFAHRIASGTLGGGLRVIPLSIAKETAWTNIINTELRFLRFETNQLQSVEIE